MSAPNNNSTARAANSSISSSVPKWGEPGFVTVEGATFGEDGFVPCGRSGNRTPRANLHHTADECRFGDPLRSATDRVPRREAARGASTSDRGRSRQNVFSGSNYQNNSPGLGPSTTFPGFGQQNNYPGYGQQNFHPGYGQQIQQLQQEQQHRQIQLQHFQQQLQQQHQHQQQQMQYLLQLAQHIEQQPSAGPPRHGGHQEPGATKNKKRSADDHWQSGPRKRHKRSPGDAGGAGAGGQATI
ncbi:hypothetical protein M436DRAFT_65668 [Aureobasidium namibiae CBS 147.97]|uniref:Uncharacterized protein n=1 Tax=Aureobasidium namibiae CBS 147.97 TaxID=1043004 RepID=A0A074WEV2_9PEZI